METVRELSPHSGTFKNIGATWRRGKEKEDRGPRVELFHWGEMSGADKASQMGTSGYRELGGA